MQKTRKVVVAPSGQRGVAGAVHEGLCDHAPRGVAVVTEAGAQHGLVRTRAEPARWCEARPVTRSSSASPTPAKADA